jgi:hypothetical protein
MVWCLTFEGDERWSMVRTPSDWTEDMVFGRAQSGLSGGVGGDAAEIIRIESGWDDGLWNDYAEGEL